MSDKKNKNIRTPYVPVLEPLTRYTVSFTNHSGEVVVRQIAGTDEVDVAKAARRYFAVTDITAIVRQGSIYITSNRHS